MNVGVDGDGGVVVVVAVRGVAGRARRTGAREEASGAGAVEASRRGMVPPVAVAVASAAVAAVWEWASRTTLALAAVARTCSFWSVCVCVCGCGDSLVV